MENTKKHILEYTEPDTNNDNAPFVCINKNRLSAVKSFQQLICA